MAQKDRSNPEFNPKHRIVGAIILVSLAVIFLPMILDEREPPTEVKPISDIPEPKEAESLQQTKVVVTPVEELRRDKGEPSGSKPASTPVQKAQAKPGTPTEIKAPEAVTGPAKDATETTAKGDLEPGNKTSKPAASPARTQPTRTKAQASDKGWVVQVGTFTNTANATRLETKLKQRGHMTSMENITLKGTKAVRLRVGPFRDKSLALKAQAQIHKDVGVSGVVLAYP